MCGIAGFLHRPGNADPDAQTDILRRMTDRLRHRGPDGDGLWTDPVAGIALGHRRLAILDLSPTGQQPMLSADGRFVLTYNGELYNYRDFTRELEAEGVTFRGSSDTEVLLEAFARHGVAPTLDRAIGLFAFALWDRETRTLWLGRDQLGIKPLYWGLFGDTVLFGSELKALREHPGWEPVLNRDAAAAYFRFNTVPGPHSIYRGVFKLPPGCVLTLRPGVAPEITAYWDLRTVARAGQADRLQLSDEDATDRLEALLTEAVHRQMVADVPLGVLLSGGIDSSTVTALAQSRSRRPVRSFSIGFAAEDYDEAPHARAIARHLGTDHTELYVDAAQALAVIPTLPEMYDEPFADSSQIPTYLVSALTRQHVTVVLSGDGGDELFAGYNRHAQASLLSALPRRLPGVLRAPLARALRALPPARLDRWARLLPGRARLPNLGEKLHKLGTVLDAPDADAAYRRLVSHWTEADNPMRAAKEPGGVLWDPTVAGDIPDFLERMQFLDSVTYLPDDILTKVDRASMAVALEARVPLLDPGVVAFAWRLPPRFKLRDGQGKWLLRQVLARHVPPSLTDRPKMGFTAPIGAWLRGPLRDWAEHLLDARRLDTDGLLDPTLIRRRWRQHLSGNADWQYPLWDVLMFQAWHSHWMGAD